MKSGRHVSLPSSTDCNLCPVLPASQQSPFKPCRHFPIFTGGAGNYIFNFSLYVKNKISKLCIPTDSWIDIFICIKLSSSVNCWKHNNIKSEIVERDFFTEQRTTRSIVCWLWEREDTLYWYLSHFTICNLHSAQRRKNNPAGIAIRCRTYFLLFPSLLFSEQKCK